MTNRLYFGDNLSVLSEHVASERVDLVDKASIGVFITPAESSRGKKLDISWVAFKRAGREETTRQEKLL